MTHDGCGWASLKIVAHFSTLATLPQLLEGTFCCQYLRQAKSIALDHWTWGQLIPMLLASRGYHLTALQDLWELWIPGLWMRNLMQEPKQARLRESMDMKSGCALIHKCVQTYGTQLSVAFREWLCVVFYVIHNRNWDLFTKITLEKKKWPPPFLASFLPPFFSPSSARHLCGHFKPFVSLLSNTMLWSKHCWIIDIPSLQTKKRRLGKLM